MASDTKPQEFKVGDSVQSKCVVRKNHLWIDAKITKINPNGTYNLKVSEPQRWSVNPNAVQVPRKDIRAPPNVNIPIGSYVIVDNIKRGTVMWAGKNKVLPEGDWLGIALDQKRGFCDGTWKGVKFFHCKRWHGIMVLTSRVTKVVAYPGDKSKKEGMVITRQKPNAALAHARSVKLNDIPSDPRPAPMKLKMADFDERSDVDEIKENSAVTPKLIDNIARLKMAPKLSAPPNENAYFEEDPRTPVDEMRKTFDTFDLNHDGRITPEEMLAVMKTLGAELELDEIVWLIDEFDVNENGTIEWVEFIRMMKGIGAADSETLRSIIDAQK